MRIEDDVKLDFGDVLIKPKRSTLQSRSDVVLHKTYKFKYGKFDYTGIPIIAANMDTTGTIEIYNELKKHDLSVAFHKYYSADELFPIFNDDHNTIHTPFYTTGITQDNHNKLMTFVHGLDNDLKFLCVDVANGYQQQFVDYIRRLRDMKEFEKTVIMAGNVVSADMTEALIIEAGVDVVKVGIGQGSVCTTRLKTGIGMPQLSAIIECADAAHGLGAHVCSDGGCSTPGDIGKAFGAGADFVMLGSMLAGHTESGGQPCYDSDGKIIHKYFYGMSSTTAMNEHSGGVAKHRASEGKKVKIPYRGPVENTILEILGSLRSTCTYTGSKSLKELPKRCTFVRVHSTHNTSHGDDWKTQ